VWFDERAITAWRNTAPAQGPGAPRLYADGALECTLVLQAAFHLSLRATPGFLSSVMELLALALPVPDYSTVSRRQATLAGRWSFTVQSGPRHVVNDATGLKVYGAGEWHQWKHRVRRRRMWRKLHLGIDATSTEIVASALTDRAPHPHGIAQTRGETTKPIEWSHVPTRDLLRGSRGLKTITTGQRFLECFEGLQALRPGYVNLRALGPGYQATKTCPHETTRAVMVALNLLWTQLKKTA